MNNRCNEDRRSDGWRTLAVLAQRAAPPLMRRPPAGFVERVLAARATDRLRLAPHRQDRSGSDRNGEERLITWAAGLALAASLALLLWNWPEIEGLGRFTGRVGCLGTSGAVVMSVWK